MKSLMIVLILMGCTSKPPEKTDKKQVSIDSKLLASEHESTLVTEVSFTKKSPQLSNHSKKEIEKLFHEAKKKGEIDKVKVISWADLEYPSVHEENLSEDQVRLARNRGDMIENYLKKLNDDIEVEKISMATRPGKLDQMISNEEAQIKKSLETGGLPNTDTTVKVPGKASKTIVIFTLEK